VFGGGVDGALCLMGISRSESSSEAGTLLPCADATVGSDAARSPANREARRGDVKGKNIEQVWISGVLSGARAWSGRRFGVLTRSETAAGSADESRRTPSTASSCNDSGTDPSWSQGTDSKQAGWCRSATDRTRRRQSHLHPSQAIRPTRSRHRRRFRPSTRPQCLRRPTQYHRWSSTPHRSGFPQRRSRSCRHYRRPFRR
jgi:hypothetical protein